MYNKLIQHLKLKTLHSHPRIIQLQIEDKINKSINEEMKQDVISKILIEILIIINLQCQSEEVVRLLHNNN